MKSFENVFVYQTALKAFKSSSFKFSDTIEEIQSSSLSSSSNSVYIFPGFIDIHMHIESSMLTPTSFSRAALRHGTTTVVSDCHEIANVRGVRGLQEFMQMEVENSTFYALPSSVPSTSDNLETSDASFDSKEVEELCSEKKIIALGEVMNANDLFSASDNRTKRIISTFKRLRPECPVEGHCPRFTGKELDFFISAGVDSDHTEQTPESFNEKINKGMFLELQYKSISPEIIEQIIKHPEYDGHFSFCTDDVLPDILVNDGHLNRCVKKAIEFGLSAERAIYAATWAPAVRMRLFNRGWIAPGKRADFIVCDDLKTLAIKEVYVAGNCVWSRQDGYKKEYKMPFMTDEIRNSIKRDFVSPENFSLTTHFDGEQKITVIYHQKNSTMTKKEERVVVAKNHKFPLEGFSILASVERYGNNFPVVPIPLCNGLNKPGAICSSWAHDSHNLLVLASNEQFAAKAVNVVIKNGGGICCVDDSCELFVSLPYAGIVSPEPAEELAKKIEKVRAWLSSHGYEALDEIMNFAVLALPVSPEVKVSDRGMVDVKNKCIIDWRNKK